MTYQIPTREPTELTIGTAWAWDIRYSDHRSDEGWTLAYYLRGPEDLDITSTDSLVVADSSGGFEIRVPRATTDDLTGNGGAYRLTGRVFKASDPADGRIVYDGHLLLLADPLTAVGGKSFNRQMLDAIDEALLAGVSSSAEAKRISINGRSIEYRDSTDLEGRRSHYALLVALEENPDGTIYHAGEFVNA